MDCNPNLNSDDLRTKACDSDFGEISIVYLFVFAQAYPESD